jgi:type VI secretion system protein ImpM
MPEPSLADSAEVRLGFYGKLPARGDFVTRRLPRGFVEPWDAWLQTALASASGQLRENWPAPYLEAPLWRFLVGAGVCGSETVAGVVMPSVDSVGRYFPLTLAAPMANCGAPTRTLVNGATWYERVEELALSALADDADFDAFDRESEAMMALSPAGGQTGASDFGIFQVYEGEDGLRDVPGRLGDAVLARLWDNWALWWTIGSERIRPCMLVTKELPGASRFAAFLDGQWEQWGWAIR